MAKKNEYYVSNDSLERNLFSYYDTGGKKYYDELCITFFKIANHLSISVVRQKKYRVQASLVDDIIQAGTLKAIKEINKFDKYRKKKVLEKEDTTINKETKGTAKAFNFFTTVIRNEMVQEIMKQDRKNWYNHDTKKETYKRRLKEEYGINGVVVEYDKLH